MTSVQAGLPTLARGGGSHGRSSATFQRFVKVNSLSRGVERGIEGPEHLTVSLFLCSYESNAQGKSSALEGPCVSS